MEELLQTFLDCLVHENFIAIVISIIGAILSTILVLVKTRKTTAEKEYIKAQKELNAEFVPDDYLCLVNGIYYPMSEVQFVKRDTVSLEEYLKSKKGDISDENES